MSKARQVFSTAAQLAIEESGIDVDDDAESIRNGSTTPQQLLAFCLDGVDTDRYQGWVDYVNELCRAVYAEDQRVFEPLTLDALRSPPRPRIDEAAVARHFEIASLEERAQNAEDRELYDEASRLRAAARNLRGSS